LQRVPRVRDAQRIELSEERCANIPQPAWHRTALMAA
jgi:hypothetical protein